MHALGIEALVVGHLEERANDVAADPGGAGLAGNAKPVSTTGDFDIEPAFDLAQVLVELTAEVGEPLVVGGFQDNVPGNLGCIQVQVLTTVIRICIPSGDYRNWMSAV